jgi:GNAT superfamily N-acetyltransferase
MTADAQAAPAGSQGIGVRSVQPGDGAALHSMVKALAESHGYGDDVFATPQDYEDALFRKDAIIGAFIATFEGKAAGCAIWHRSFSTFRGRETIYLEDLSVLPEYRRKGIAGALLKAVAKHAVERGIPQVSWLMIAWNEGARKLYQAAGAEVEDGNCFCRLHGEALERLAR